MTQETLEREFVAATEQYQVGFEDLTVSARIREVALRLFGQHGTRGTSIRMIADAAGVSVGAIVHHFKTKDGLRRAVQTSIMQKLRDAKTGVGLADPPGEAMRHRRATTDQFMTENPEIRDYIRTMYAEAGPAGVELFREQLEFARTEMQAMVDAGVARPFPDPEAGLIVYVQIMTAQVLLRPVVEQALGLDLSDPAAAARLREATVDILTRAVFPPAG